LYEELIHVPLLMRAPGCSGNAFDEPFSLLHLAPTLLEMIGQSPCEAFQGKSYWKHIDDATQWHEPCVAEAVGGCTNPFIYENRLQPRIMAIRNGRFKLHVRCASGSVQFFDLEADPSECKPLSAADNPSAFRHLLQIADDHLCVSMNQRDTRRCLRSKLRDIQLQWPKLSVKSEYVLQ
jgi:arylsulfatase A-like enzyme